MSKNKWYIRQVNQKVKSGGYKGLVATAEPILDEAQRITPIDTGELETSGRIDGDFKNLTVYISFDKWVNGFDVASEQHENPTYNHAPGKTWKYLESPTMFYGPALLPNTLKEELEKALK